MTEKKITEKKIETKIRVQYYETDAMGIVHHSNYIRYFETARTELIRVFGFSYDRMEREGVWMPVLEVNARYKQPAVYDEVINVSCRVARLRGASVDLEYEVHGEDGRLCAVGSSRHGFTSPDLKPLKLKKAAPEIYKVFAEMDDSETKE